MVCHVVPCKQRLAYRKPRFIAGRYASRALRTSPFKPCVRGTLRTPRKGRAVRSSGNGLRAGQAAVEHLMQPSRLRRVGVRDLDEIDLAKNMLQRRRLVRAYVCLHLFEQRRVGTGRRGGRDRRGRRGRSGGRRGGRGRQCSGRRRGRSGCCGRRQG